MRYLFIILLLLNVAEFTYYGYLATPKDSQSVLNAKQGLTNPVTYENVTAELPPMIGTKK